jgi:hypothetical protein
LSQPLTISAIQRPIAGRLRGKVLSIAVKNHAFSFS